MERTSTGEVFSLSSWIFECGCFLSIASTSLINPRGRFSKSGFHFTCGTGSFSWTCNRDGWGSIQWVFRPSRRLHFCEWDHTIQTYLLDYTARQRMTYCYHGRSRFEEAKLIWKRIVPHHSAVCLATKRLLRMIAHITILRIAAMLNATQIVSMPKVSIVCIQNRQPWMSSDFSRNFEVRARDASWNTRDARFKGVLWEMSRREHFRDQLEKPHIHLPVRMACQQWIIPLAESCQSHNQPIFTSWCRGSEYFQVRKAQSAWDRTVVSEWRGVLFKEIEEKTKRDRE
jgi:hypothetical protein